MEACLSQIRECLERGWTGMGFKTVEAVILFLTSTLFAASAVFIADRESVKNYNKKRNHILKKVRDMKVNYKNQVTEFFADSVNTTINMTEGGTTGRILMKLSNITENIPE